MEDTFPAPNNELSESSVVNVGKPSIRYVQAFLFVATYIGLGFILKLNPNAYLLIGIPMVVAFQLFICKKPIHAMWVREGIKFHLNKWALMIAIGLSVLPIKMIVSMIVKNQFNSIGFIYLTATVVGALGAGYAILQFTKGTLRLLLLCLAIAGGIGISMFLTVALIQSFNLQRPFSFDSLVGIKSLLVYFPVSFIIEEVVFRGAIDSHVHHPNQTKGVWSAIFVSALWGLWHLPIIPAKNFVDILGASASLILVHTTIGIPLSIFWRRSGNLAVPALSHAFIDAIRNALGSH